MYMCIKGIEVSRHVYVCLFVRFFYRLTVSDGVYRLTVSDGVLFAHSATHIINTNIWHIHEIEFLLNCNIL